MPGIWVYAEIGADGAVEPGALENLTKARELSSEIAGVCLGPGASAAAAVLGAHGAATLFAADDAVFTDYLAQPAAHALHQLVHFTARLLPRLGRSPGGAGGRTDLEVRLGLRLRAAGPEYHLGALA